MSNNIYIGTWTVDQKAGYLAGMIGTTLAGMRVKPGPVLGVASFARGVYTAVKIENLARERMVKIYADVVADSVEYVEHLPAGAAGELRYMAGEVAQSTKLVDAFAYGTGLQFCNLLQHAARLLDTYSNYVHDGRPETVNVVNRNLHEIFSSVQRTRMYGDAERGRLIPADSYSADWIIAAPFWCRWLKTTRMALDGLRSEQLDQTISAHLALHAVNPERAETWLADKLRREKAQIVDAEVRWK